MSQCARVPGVWEGVRVSRACRRTFTPLPVSNPALPCISPHANPPYSP